MSKEKEKEKAKEVEDEIVTINDFKSMLIGMDLILGDKWTPDENQWGRLRKKIDALIETAERPVVNTRNFAPNVVPNVASNANVSETELISTFPAVPAAENVPVGMQPTAEGSALTPTTPARPPVAKDAGVHRTDEFI